MDAWLRDLILATASGLKALGDAVWQRIQQVYNLIVTVGIAVRLGWGFLLATVKYKFSRLIDLARQGYLTFYWLIWIRIPQVANSVIDFSIEWAANAILIAKREITETVRLFAAWAKQVLADLWNSLVKLGTWALNEITEIRNLLGRVTDLVFMLLTSPERMAKWLLWALVREAIRFADDNAEQLLDWARRRSVYYAGRVAERIEDVLVRML